MEGFVVLDSPPPFARPSMPTTQWSMCDMKEILLFPFFHPVIPVATNFLLSIQILKEINVICIRVADRAKISRILGL